MEEQLTEYYPYFLILPGDVDKAKEQHNDIMIQIVLAAYNEEKDIGPLLESIHQNMKGSTLHYKIIVVNDGSEDGTAELVKTFGNTLPIVLAEHNKNKGLAEALNTGFDIALADDEPENVVVTMDADNTQDPSIIPEMIREIHHGADMVIASRYLKGSRVQGVSWMRRLLSWVANRLFRFFYPINSVRDYTCGYRAYKARLLKQAMKLYRQDLLNQAGFSCTVELLLKLRKFNPVVQEVPFILRYDRKRGSSKMKVGRTMFGLLMLLLKRARK